MNGRDPRPRMVRPLITRGFPETMSVVLAALCALTRLRQLELSSLLNHRPIELPRHTIPRFHLTHLSLFNCALRDVDLAWLGSSSLDSLVSFKLADVVGISEDGLKSFLSPRHSTLRELHISLWNVNPVNPGWGLGGNAPFAAAAPPAPATFDLALSSLSVLSDLSICSASFSSLLLHNLNPSLSSSLRTFTFRDPLDPLDEADLLVFIQGCGALEAVSSGDVSSMYETEMGRPRPISELECYIAKGGSV